ncbi:MAG TPA: hypothetical protein PKC21_10675 [Oligoflexia bacterium]|nr:hypothetical protein [Oligoflexia bacterium]HMR25800.1 hypothetical protein [Oligoflexia bacterium]
MKKNIDLVLGLILMLTACGGSTKENITLNQEQQQTILEFLVDVTQEDIIDAAIFAAVDTSVNSFFANLSCTMGDMDVQGQAQLNIMSGNVQWIAQNLGQSSCSFLSDTLKITSAQLDWSGQNSILGLGATSLYGELQIALEDLEPQLCEVSLQINAIVNQVAVEGLLCKVPVQAVFNT